MEIVQYTPNTLSSITEFYNELTAEVPHCYPVKEEEFALAMGKVVTGEYRRDSEKHNSERVFIALSDDTIKAFVHTVLSLKAENEEEDVGFIRFLGYERGERNAGQAALEKAFQGQGLGRYLLNYTLQEMHNVGYRHAAISTNWENYRALLFYSNCGYKVVDWTYEYEKNLPRSVPRSVKKQ